MTKNLNKRLIIVSNRLPFQIKMHNHKLELKESDGGLVSGLKSYFEKQSGQPSFASTLWIGSAEFSENRWLKVSGKNLSNINYDVVPVFVDKKIYDMYYNGFCNATLWPLFHYFPSFVEFDNETFKCYKEVNRMFAEKLLSVWEPGDVIWIHDYHLMLLPEMIRKHKPDATIGFFLHIPFPSYEVFRLLHKSWKENIVSGLLGADLIGFHTHEYVQHFLKTIQMTVGYDHQFRNIFLPNGIVKAEMFPLGIDFDKFNNSIVLPEVIDMRNSIKENFSGKKIIFSVDRLDYTKGITQRLAGFERFLEQNPEWHEKVVFIQIIVPSRQVISKYTERKKLIEEEIGRINGRYSNLSWQPIIYRYSQLSFVELVAIYNVADIGLITPLRDGMNLVAKEFIASKSEDGVLILSDLAGAANEMGQAILVNPMDPDEVAGGILNALTMPEELQRHKLTCLQQRLKDYTVKDWFNDFLGQLHEIKVTQRTQETKYLTTDSLKELISKFHSARKRLLLLDYDGTLVPFAKHPSLAAPDRSLVGLLSDLSGDERNNITIISGRDDKTLEAWFGELPVNLVSEHGAGVRMKGAEWKFAVGREQKWKLVLRPVFDLYCQRSPGSFIEEKNHTLAWHYRNVDPELGFIRSRELLDNLHHMIRNSLLRIIDGNKVIEVRIGGIDKGTISRKLFGEGEYDFVLVLGDDKTDEDMFKVMFDAGYTIKVGTGHTHAKFNLANQQEVLKLLLDLGKTHELIAHQ